MRNVLKASFSTICVEPDAVWIIDEAERDRTMSVTNNAEAVVEVLVQAYGARRIFYRDTSGEWDELLHHGPVFSGFKAGTDGRTPPRSITQ